MAKRYICDAFDTLYDFKHECDKACFLCTATAPSSKDQSKYSSTCNRCFLSEKCFQNYLTLIENGKLVCQWRQVCRNCSYTVNSDPKREWFKRFCNYYYKNQTSGHSYSWLYWNLPSWQIGLYMFPLIRSCTKDLEKLDGSFAHIPKLRCAQQIYLKCEAVDEWNVYCKQCGKVFWVEDPVGKLIDYLQHSRPIADKMYVISHNSRE